MYYKKNVLSHIHRGMHSHAIDLPNAPQPIQNTLNQMLALELDSEQWDWEFKLTDVIN